MSDKKGTLYWITGLSGTGKTTIGSRFHKHLKSSGFRAVFLDGDHLREIFGANNSYSPQERLKLAIQYSKLCKMLTEQGFDVICATISLFKECHQWNRSNIENYREIYLRVPMEILIKRDSKKIYSRALKGELKQVMGIDIPFKEPENPDIIIENTGADDPDSIVRKIYEKFIPGSRGKNLLFGTKAETLNYLYPKVKSAEINKIYYFSAEQWERDYKRILQEIKKHFKKDRYLAIRSSAQEEDTEEKSMAGAFHSFLGIDCLCAEKVSEAIEKIIASYSGNPKDQILVQAMAKDIAVSGVIMTRNLEDGAPYYVLNYDDNSGRTDSVTGGTGVHKTVLISREYDEKYVESPRIRKMLKLAKELEAIYGTIPLDIEFGISNKDKMYLFQTRPISVYKSWNPGIEKKVSHTLPLIEETVKKQSAYKKNIFGEKTILATMSDWNPAEMLGIIPNPLAASLYRELITRDTWSLARKKMGYRALEEELMVMILNRPYIDVRNSFNSFLPEGINTSAGNKLINAWIERLQRHPELHDKIEFEIAQTCVDFGFEDDFSCRYAKLLSKGEKDNFKRLLLSLTKNCLHLTPENTLIGSLQAIEELNKCQKQRQKQNTRIEKNKGPLKQIFFLLEECKRLGTLSFAVIARHAFIAESFLRSAVKKEAVSEERIKTFKKSLRTITGQLAVDMISVCANKMQVNTFMRKYGHLRPGTYDITSLSYEHRNDLFKNCFIPRENFHDEVFSLSRKEKSAIDKLLSQSGIDNIGAAGLFEYAAMAIKGREYAKFVFSKNLSEALETLAQWGKLFGLSREDLSLLDVEKLAEVLNKVKIKDVPAHCHKLIEEIKPKIILSGEIKLSYIIRGVGDVYVVPLHRSAPNFIGSKKIESRTIEINSNTPASIGMNAKIACIENADPGFDWIFTKGIQGLITKYGGANSHMAIRCAEFGLPAAIGCGEDTFNRIIKAGIAELNCAGKVLRPLYGE